MTLVDRIDEMLFEPEYPEATAYIEAFCTWLNVQPDLLANTTENLRARFHAEYVIGGVR